MLKVSAPLAAVHHVGSRGLSFIDDDQYSISVKWGHCWSVGTAILGGNTRFCNGNRTGYSTGRYSWFRINVYILGRATLQWKMISVIIA